MTDLSTRPARFVEPYPMELRADLPRFVDLHVTYDHNMWHTPECFHASQDSGIRVQEVWRPGIPREVMEATFTGMNGNGRIYFCEHCIVRRPQ